MIETIFIVGPAGSGKNAFATELSQALAAGTSKSWLVADTSAPLIRWLAEILAVGPWPAGHDGVKQWKEYIRANKELYRPMLAKLGDALRSVHPETLVAMLMQECMLERRAIPRIVTGFRYFNEIPTPGEFVLIYVERLGDTTVRTHDGFESARFRKMANHIITNDGDAGALSIKAQMLARKLMKGAA